MKKNIIKTTVISFLALGLLSITSSSYAAKKGEAMEKCLGIAAKGKGDGKAIINNKEQEWVLLPAGQCEKLIGGEVYLDIE